MRQTKWQSVPATLLKSRAREQDIDLAVEKLARELVEGIEGPPTDLDALAKRLNIAKIQNDDTMVVPGEMRDLNGKLVVFLIPSLPTPRRRFTIAHELGHAVFERLGLRPRPSRELEMICDKFAASFLMPRETFVARAGSAPNLGKLRDLCGTFSTSLQATVGRAASIYSYRAFETREDTVVWSHKLSNHALSQLTHAYSGLDGQSGNDDVLLLEGRFQTLWTLEWETLDSHDHRIGLLRRKPRYVH